VVSRFTSYRSLIAREDEARALAESKVDAEMAALAQEELDHLDGEIDRAAGELLRDLVAEDENAAKDVIMEIRAGTGGDEATLFAGDLLRMYLRFADRHGWKAEVLDGHKTDVGGYKEVIVAIGGDHCYDLLRFESGGHRVQRVPETEAHGRIQTSAATVAVLPEADEVEVAIDPGDLKIDTYRAGGPGGQNVNKTSSAIRITHLPSGLVVQCQDESSQHKNKAKAMRVLRSRLYEMETSRRRAERDQSRRTQIGTGDRSDRIRTYHWGRSQVTDHRLKDSWSLHKVLDGDLEPIVSQLRELDLQERIKQLT
jgi:peptide chain release factor 1